MRAMPSCRKWFFIARIRKDDGQFIGSQAESVLHSLGDANFMVICNFQAVLNDLDHGGKSFDRFGIVCTDDFFAQPDAEITLLLKKFKKLRRFCVFGNGDSKGEEYLLTIEGGEDIANDGRCGALGDFTSARRTETLRDTREEEF